MNKFEPKQVELKNGKIVLIRQATILDAEKLLNCIKQYVPQSDYIPKYGHEITLNVRQEEDWINSFITNDNSLLLIAEFDNQIIGNIDLTGNRREIMAHTAVIGMGMLVDWQNNGLGTILLSSIIEWAKQNPILELIWLQVYTANVLGMKLYHKMGFQENGVLKNFFKQDGSYFDNLTMSMSVK